MSFDPDHGINDPDVQAIESCDIPCVQGLLAATLALMTAHAQAGSTPDRTVLAIKTVSNLLFLAEHPAMSPGFRGVAWRLREQWIAQVQLPDCTCSTSMSPTGADHAADALPRDIERTLWHRTAGDIQ